MKNDKNWLQRTFKRSNAVIIENTYNPPMGVNDEIRKQVFTHFDVNLMNEIRRIKSNNIDINPIK